MIFSCIQYRIICILKKEDIHLYVYIYIQLVHEPPRL